jgi:hypothetical protein
MAFELLADTDSFGDGHLRLWMKMSDDFPADDA